MKFLRFDPVPCAFAQARLSPLPERLQLTLRSSRRSPGATPKPPAQLRHYARGRYALAAAYQLSGVGANGALLAPSYHCVTMLDPALALSAEIALYPLRADLAPDLAQLDATLASCKTPVRALLATHFFGFAQDFSRLKDWCDAHGLVLIEDCSHVLCTDDFQAAGTGVYGRYVVASPYKFFASADGGLLYAPRESLPDELVTHRAGLLPELRGAKRLLDKAPTGRVAASDIDAIDAQLAALRARLLATGNEQAVDRSQASAQYVAALARSASLRSSRALIRHSSIEQNARRRRANYRRWSRALAGVDNCRPLYAELPDACVPYMFALCLEAPDPHFYWLKHLGVPIWRWDEMAASTCAVAQDYRLHLIHLPCHQSLSEIELSWMITAVQRALCQKPPGAGR